MNRDINGHTKEQADLNNNNMGYLIGIGFSFLLAAIVATLWVRGIDYMKENHPDYKGEDLFGEWDDTENTNKK